jgi:hypothetical protein
VNVSIDQVEPTVAITDAPAAVRFGGTYTVRGALTVGNTTVERGTVVVELGGQEFGTVPIENGSFTTTVEIPAGIPSGEQQLTVGLPPEPQALANGSATQSVTVEETATELSLSAQQSSSDDMMVSLDGRLTTAAGAAVAGEPVVVEIAGQRVNTFDTDANGTFAGSVSIPADQDEAELTVTVSYRATTTNLGPSEQRQTITLGTGEQRSIGDLIPGSDEQRSIGGLILGGGGVLVVVLAVGILWYRSRANNEPDEETGTEPPTVTVTETNDSGVAPSLIERSREQLQAGQPERAVQSCYAAVRSRFETEIDGAEALTHWEFCQAVQDDGSTAAGTLRTITEEYEHATYSGETIDQTYAQRTIENAQKILKEER